jgi:hypothetical protein
MSYDLHTTQKQKKPEVAYLARRFEIKLPGTCTPTGVSDKGEMQEDIYTISSCRYRIRRRLTLFNC